jgi:hypothetical protein
MSNSTKPKIPVDGSARLILEKYEAPHFIYSDLLNKPSAPNTPSLWFSYHFQKEAKTYGPPILEMHVMEENMPKVTPLHTNQDFFAAMLGNERCGSVIWYSPELRWYRKTGESYTVATDEDLKLTLSQQFIRCCEEMVFYVDKEMLFETFRQEEVLNGILQRATAVLWKGKEFFAEGSGNRRSPLVVPHEGLRRFADEVLRLNDSAVLTVRNCYDAYSTYCTKKHYAAVPTQEFKRNANFEIKRRFNRTLRRDLLKLGGDAGQGWRGITCLAT